jgi:hypothetical protein
VLIGQVGGKNSISTGYRKLSLDCFFLIFSDLLLVGDFSSVEDKKKDKGSIKFGKLLD